MNNFARLDFKKRQRFLTNELKFVQLKTIFHDLSFTKFLRFKAKKKMISIKHNIKNRCFISSRGKAVYSKLGISRIMLRSLAHQGLMIGFSKASW